MTPIKSPFPLAASALQLAPARRREVLACFTTLGLAAVVVPANAQLLAQLPTQSRRFPEKAAYGHLRITQPPEALLDDKAVRLAPGARIYGVDNLLLLSGTLVGKTLAVAYLNDSYGLLHQVWVLTEAERKAASTSKS